MSTLLDARFAVDDAILAQTQLELETVERIRAERALAVEHAQVALDVANQRRDQLIARRDHLRNDILQHRLQMRGGAKAFPEEVLSEIFLHVLPPYTLKHGAHQIGRLRTLLERDDIDYERALLPGVLSLVCRRWRDAALHTRDLHSYLAIPPRTSRASSILAYISRTIARSRLLDVYVQYVDSRSDEGTSTHQPEYWSQIFDVLYENSERLRTLDLAVIALDLRPDSGDHYDDMAETICDLALGLFRLPTPNLEHASFNLRHSRDDLKLWIPAHMQRQDLPLLTLPTYLPDAPRLQSLWLHHVPIMCVTAALPSLKVLSIANDYLYKGHVWSMLRLCPVLEEFYIRCEDMHGPRPGEPQLEAPTSLPIRTLGVDLQSGLDAVGDDQTMLPNLTSVILPGYMDEYLLHKAKDTITSLEIFSASCDDETSVAVWAEFANIEHAHIRQADTFDLGGLVNLMCKEDGPMWPRLRTLKLGVDDQWAGHRGSSLIRLVETRKERGATSGSGVRALEKIAVTKESTAAGWVIARLRKLLGPENLEIWE
ncbi:hypothetical protein EXIGLDRAFT_769858 [Exidia glandulosa HHB12029]|uniref:Uncharacterized protein n=1 Tax=Exidia glandulosa HHB12029 TaxID=1314781 RepID=A0A165H673_EXIGL|nr:hypothetical protein EXIGLDRAFT_769858 [Exidia glandulosa HHB12029]